MAVMLREWINHTEFRFKPTCKTLCSQTHSNEILCVSGKVALRDVSK